MLGSRVRNIFSNQGRSFIYDMPRSVNFRVLSDSVGQSKLKNRELRNIDVWDVTRKSR